MTYSIENHIRISGVKRYSNNRRIVDADDEYLSTSEWRNINQLFRIDKIHKSIFPSNAKLPFGFREYPNNPNNLITGYTP